MKKKLETGQEPDIETIAGPREPPKILEQVSAPVSFLEAAGLL